MTEQNQIIVMETATTYSPEENIIAQILIQQNPSAEMETTTTYIPIEATGTEQNHSVQLDANSAFSLLERAIAQSMAEQSSDMDGAETYFLVEASEDCTRKNDSEHLNINAGYTLLEKTVAQRMTEHSAEEIDTSSYISVEKVTEQNETEKCNSEQINKNSASSLLEKTISQTMTNQNRSRPVNSTSVRREGKILGTKAYCCNICDTVFSVNSSLIKHMLRAHRTERMRYFSCAYCSRTFKIRKNLVRHMHQTHNIHIPDNIDTSCQAFGEDGQNADVNEWFCKAKNCIRRKNNVFDQGMQTGCPCIPPKDRCLFCRKDQTIEVLETDDSECICFEKFFEPEKTFADAATETGCGLADCIDCKLCPKFDTWKNVSHIQCMECNITFVRLDQLRNHLKVVHKLMVEYETHRFPDMTTFKKWKSEVERRDVTRFIKPTCVKKSTKGLKHFYECHRSGKFEARIPKKEKMVKKASWKLGITCTSSMYCEECPDGVTVKYWPGHYGHGKETSFVQISPEEQAAIQESVSSGVSVENLLDDIRDHQSSSDQSQLYLMKKRDACFIKNAFNAVEYNNNLSDADSVDQWVRACCQMEESPILFYRQELAGSGEDFLLIIMTEFQKQILMSSDKQVVCVDSYYRQKRGRFYLTVLFVMDECDIAFPVAYCISSKVDKEVIVQFFTSIKESTGHLNPHYFMSDNLKFYYDAWLEVMEADSKWLWCLWYVDNNIKLQLRHFKSAKRVQVYNTMQVLMECQNETVFHSIYKKYMESLSDPLSKSMGSVVEKFMSTAKMWAYCYRKEIKSGFNLRLEAMHYTFRYCCREGRKKRLDKFIFVIMKLVRYKMLDRLTNVLDEENIDLAVQAINRFHDEGLEISTENISSLCDKIWLIQSEDEGDVYVTCDLESCPDNCKLKCAECDICVHMYSCSCMNSLINANLCQHIHAIAWKFLTPQFSPSASPVPDHCDEEMGDSYSTDTPVKTSELLDNVLKRAHEVYKKAKAKKCDLKRDTLADVMKRLNECVDLISGKAIQEESANQVFFSATFLEEDNQPVLPSEPTPLSREPIFKNVPTTVPAKEPIFKNVPTKEPIFKSAATTLSTKKHLTNRPPRNKPMFQHLQTTLADDIDSQYIVVVQRNNE